MILPVHLAAVTIDSQPPKGWLSRSWYKLQSLVSCGLTFVNQSIYQPLLGKALRHRYATLVIFLTIAVCGISMIFNGWVRTVFFPEVPGQSITVELQMRNGSPLNLTMDNIKIIENAAESINAEAMATLHTDNPQIKRMMTVLNDPFNAEIYAELQPEELRKLETMETQRRWREKVGTLEGAEELNFGGLFGTGGGFIIELGAGDENVLRDAVTRFSAALNQLDGVHDVRDDFKQGSPQIRLRLKPEAQHLGLNASDLAGQIGDAFGGLEVQRLQRNDDEVKVSVKYQQQRRRYMGDVIDTRIQTEHGRWLPLSLVASIESGYVPASVNHQNGRRVVQVQASLDKERISPSEAFKWIQDNVSPELKSFYPELTIKGAGELEEVGEIKGGMVRALVMILILIYALLAVPLKSYRQPLVITFGFVGAVIGHWINGLPFSILSFFWHVGGRRRCGQ